MYLFLYLFALVKKIDVLKSEIPAREKKLNTEDFPIALNYYKPV